MKALTTSPLFSQVQVMLIKALKMTDENKEKSS